MMPDMALKQMAMMHKNDPYVLPFIISEDSRRKEMRRAAQARMAGAMPPKVNEAAVADVGSMPNVDMMGNATGYAHGGTVLPENQGIGALNAPNLQHMADGGIAGYADGGPQQPGMFNYAQMAPAVDLHPDSGVTPRSMAAGGVAHFADQGAVKAKPDYRQMMIDSAIANGVDPKVMQMIAGVEGTGKNPKSSATNFFQFIDKTYKDLGGDPALRNDPGEAIRLGGLYLGKNQKALEKSLGRAPEPHELYGTHFLGEPVGKALLTANPKQTVAEFLKNTTPKRADEIIKANPEVLGSKGEKTVGDLRNWTKLKMAGLGLPSANAGELPNKDAGLASLQNKEKMPSLEGTTGTGLGQSLIPSALIPTAREAFSASRVPGLIRGAGVATAIPVIGGMLTDKAMQDLQTLPANRRKEMVDNPMLSAMSGDVGFAAAIQDAAANNPEGPSKMPYMEQMKNAVSQIPRVITSAPSGRKGTSLGFNEETARNLVRPLNQPLVEPGTEETAPVAPVPLRDDDMSPNGEIKQGIPEKAKDSFMEAAKAELTPKKAKGMSDDDLVAFGLGLMASKNPNIGGAVGEAGLGALAMKREQQKTEREDMYRQALAREANAKASNLESGGVNTAQAMHQADVMYDNWLKSLNKMDAMSLTPEMQRAKQDEFLQRAFQAFRMATPAGISSGTATAGAQLDPLGLRKTQKVKHEHQ